MNPGSAWYVNVLHRIAAQPAIYDSIQRLAGLEKSRQWLRPLLEQTQGLAVDVGAGTGLYADLLPATSRYVWLDSDPQKLIGFRKKHPACGGVLGDAALLPFRAASLDYAMCLSMSHHLDDAALDALLRDLARVCRRGLIFLDAVDRPESLVSRLLWKYDRGSFPRRPEVLRALIERYFIIEQIVEYRVYHQYLLCLAVPKASPSPGVVH